MKFLSLVVLLLISVMNAHAQDPKECRQYHKGKFTYEDSVGNIVYIKRNKHYQTEYLAEIDVWVSFRIKWTSDCTFDLYQVGSNSKKERKNNHATWKIIITKSMGKDGYESISACDDSNIRTVVKKVSHF